MSKYYTTARLLYRLHKITANQVWAYTESDPPKITEDEALALSLIHISEPTRP